MKRIVSGLIALCLFSGIVLQTEVKVCAQEENALNTQTEVYLSDLDWIRQTCGAGQDFPNGTAKDTAVNGASMQLYVDGSEYTFMKGIGAHAPSEVVYDISGMGCTEFEAYAGVDLQSLSSYESSNEEGVVGNFIVEIDGQKKAESGQMDPSMDAWHFEVDIPEDAKELTLKAETGAQDWSDWIIWGNAKLTVSENGAEKPVLGPTTEKIKGNQISVQLIDGILQFYRGEVLIAKADTLGRVIADGSTVSDFLITDYDVQKEVKTDRGTATRLILNMSSKRTALKKTVWYDLLQEIDGGIAETVFLTSETDMKSVEVIESEILLVEPEKDKIWSYNGGGEGAQSFYDTIQKVNNSFYRANRQDDTAAGVPAADIYSVNGGITVGDASLYRKFLTTPVEGKNDTAKVSIHWKDQELKAGVKTETGTAVIGVHSGDYYNGLRIYANVMKTQGFAAPETVSDRNYDLRWESWGWEGEWTIDKIIGKLDALYEQGIRQITLDDCWYTAAGDWELNPDKFPNGAQDMKKLTEAVHAKGMTIVLWWRPMDGGRDQDFSVISGHTQKASNLLKEHPEYFVKNKDGSFAKLSGPGASDKFNGSTGYALCPYSEGAVASQTDFIRRAMTEWGIDGFKSDYVWGMPQCYAEDHHHESSRESTEMASEIFYKAIYEEMISIDPDAFHLLCNCGTPQDYYSLPYVTQIPTADPTSVDQTRRRVKAYKALAGDEFPVTTDHNEIWYPSSVGTGAVLIEKRDFAEDSAQAQEYEKWLGIAAEHQLQRGKHIGNLYSYGIDPYETYVIQKDEKMYYSFYKDGIYKPEGTPEIELKGLDPDTEYRIEDYVNQTVIAECVAGDDAVFSLEFNDYLLLRAVPLEKSQQTKPVTEIFSDVVSGKWYVDAIQYVYDHGLMSGFEQQFTPDSTMTRAMLIMTIYRMEGLPEVREYDKYLGFKDMKATAWYKDAVAWALNEKIATGDPIAQKFDPNASVTREQLAAFLYRYAKYRGEDVSLSGDVSQILAGSVPSSWAEKEFAWALDQELIKGIQGTDGSGNVIYDPSPKGTATRAQLATILQRFYEKDK